jgi:hypothetical protein
MAHNGPLFAVILPSLGHCDSVAAWEGYFTSQGIDYWVAPEAAQDVFGNVLDSYGSFQDAEGEDEVAYAA